jgi:DNA-binding HxlR family transcriptional regulator
MPKRYTPVTAAADLEKALRLLEGRWKLVILFHLFGGKIMRFSDLERAIPAITQKMLGQQLKALEADGIVLRTAYPQVPPKVEYRLTSWGQALCPALDAMLTLSLLVRFGKGDLYEEVAKKIDDEGVLLLETKKVVGGYYRFDDDHRDHMNTWARRIKTAVLKPSSTARTSSSREHLEVGRPTSFRKLEGILFQRHLAILKT